MPEDARRRLGVAVRDLREDSEISESEFSERTGLSTSFLHWVEFTGLPPGPKNFQRMAEALDLEADQLTELTRLWEKAQGR